MTITDLEKFLLELAGGKGEGKSNYKDCFHSQQDLLGQVSRLRKREVQKIW